jgi:hypothetical protein
LLATTLLVILIISPAFSSLQSSVTITSSGSISQSLVAEPGSPQDIQTAIDQMASLGGGTVYLPSAEFTFNGETVTIPGGVNVIGQGMGNTILRQTKAAPFNSMFRVSGGNGKPTRISGIQFIGLVTSSAEPVDGTAIELNEAMNFRVDHCNFTDFPNTAIGVYAYITGKTRGVIDHNIIDNPYKDVYPTTIWAYGIVISGQLWWEPDTSKFLGKYETAPSGYPIVYIEDNTFSRCRHAIASNQGAWYVARYNTISEARDRSFGQVDVHGSSGPTTCGGRGFEVYNNTIYAPLGYTAYTVAIQARGGGGVIFNNTIVLNAAMQACVYLGRDSSVPAYQVKQLYIWDNNINTGIMVDNRTNYVQDVDYFLRAPTQTQDGFSYTPYPYPHPLTLGSEP